MRISLAACRMHEWRQHIASSAAGTDNDGHCQQPAAADHIRPGTERESQTLEDVAGTDPNAPFDPNAPLDGSVDAAGLASAPLPEPPGGASEVSEDDLIGAWSAATPMATCSINLSLTTWQGGYRASTRNCGDVQLSGLTAWSIEGQQVLLRDTEGAPIGRLFRTGPTRYAGQLDTGGALTLFR
jgi:hypothetical protein